MKNLYSKYTNVIIGAICGLIVALSILIIGFFKTLLIFIFVCLGALAGWFISNTEVGNYLHIKKRK